MMMMRTTTKRTMTRKRKTTRSHLTLRPLHPFFLSRHPIVMRSFFAVSVFALAAACAVSSAAQDSPKSGGARASLPAVRKRFHREVEACYRMPTFTFAAPQTKNPSGPPPPIAAANSRFAFRPKAHYVIEVKAKGFVTQTKTVTAQSYSRLDLVFHMDPSPAKK